MTDPNRASKTINITSGECLNELLKKRYEDGLFIPFNEAMIEGTYSAELFSEEFIQERSAFHRVSTDEYKNKLKGFLLLIENPNQYETIQLWFGDEPFCVANRAAVIETLHLRGFKGEIRTNIVDESTGVILYIK